MREANGAIYIFLLLLEHSAFSAVLPHSLSLQLRKGTSKSERSQSYLNRNADICMTEECVSTALSLLNNMDSTVDPCDDFYQFSCGTFLRNTVIPPDKSIVDSFTTVRDTVSEQLRDVMEQLDHRKMNRPFNLVKNMYQSCMDTARIEELGLGILRDILKQMGGWPVVVGPEWEARKFDWRKVSYDLREKGLGFNYFFKVEVQEDAKNSGKRSLVLDQAILGMPREYLIRGLNDPVVQEYYRYQLALAQLLGAPKEAALQQLRESLEFEIKLAKISLPTAERRDVKKLYNPMKIRQVQEKFPYLTWVEYLNHLLPSTVQLDDQDTVIVFAPTYFQTIGLLIMNTPKRVQANYLMWKIVMSLAYFLPEEVREAQLKFHEMLSGQATRIPRWKECVDDLTMSFPCTAGAIYVRTYFNSIDEKEITELVHNLEVSFHEILDQLGWMDSQTRAQAKEKLDAMINEVGYPEELLDDNILDRYLAEVHTDPQQYLYNHLNVKRANIDRAFGKLREKVDKRDFSLYCASATVNAGYSFTYNVIWFPAAILQGVFFSNKRPHFMNYGAIGSVIGHEITHGFDDMGRHFNKNGNLVDWWKPETSEKYGEKAECMISQYGNYTDSELGIHVNGKLTLGENIADNGGVKEAYRAYAEWVGRHGPEQRLPNLNYNQKQLFWISLANLFCSVSKPEKRKLSLFTDPHSPNRYRVIGIVSNMKEFADDFHCPKGSNMNPENKCSVW